jgi:16S rRNA (adenine1518-N6/adenine1519-N6)-dimethyltransferase
MKTTSRRRGNREPGPGNRDPGPGTRDRGLGIGRGSGTRGPRPRKRFGQHFLEQAWVDKLIAALDASPSDTFLEIGPGRGALTKPLAPRVRELIAVEIDRDLAAALPGDVPANVRVIQGDILDVDLADILKEAPQPVRVVGNLPYNVSSPILFMLLHAAGEGTRISDATLMLQKEVADRLVARPGTGEYGTLAVQAGLLADIERVLTLPPGAFRPPPKVTSAVVRLRFRPPAADVGGLDTFERLVRGVFLQRRKTLLNALKPVAASLGQSAPELLARAALDGSRRPEELTVAEMARLSKAVL